MLAKTIKRIEDKCEELNLDVVSLAHEIVDSSTFKCKDCGVEFDARPNDLFKLNRRCPICVGGWFPRRITTDFFKANLEYNYKGKFTVLGEYTGNKNKIEIKCNICSNEFKSRPNDLLTGYGCPECGKQKCREVNLKGVEEYNAEFESLSNNEYSIIDYNVNDGYFIKHNKCNHVWSENILYGTKEKLKKGTVACPECTTAVKKFTIPELNKRIKEVTNDNYEVQDDYFDVNTPCTIKHVKCGNYFKTRVGSMIYNEDRNSLCPCLKQTSISKGEKNVLEFIKQNYKGKILRNVRDVIGKNIELDIYLKDIKVAIEYNGIYWHSTETTKEKAIIKKGTIRLEEINQYKIKLCAKKGIRLIQIFEDEWCNKTKKEQIKKILLAIIKDPTKFINNEAKWGYSQYEKQITLNEPRLTYLFNSRKVETEIESNNSIYDAGTFNTIYDDYFNKIKSLNIPYKRDIKYNNEKFDLYFPEHKVLVKILNPFLYNEKNGYKGKELLDIKNHIESKGYKILFIYSSEFNKSDILFSKTCHILNINNKPKIYARKCTIKEITNPKEKNEFLNKYHLQGSDSSSIKLGLYYQEELVSVITFCKPRISLGHKSSSTKYDYELSRFASNNNYIVIGGFSKLLTYFKNNYEWNAIVTYADKRYSQGNLYNKNGFVKQKDSQPSYSYLNLKNDNYNLEYRFTYRKQELKRLFPKTYSDDKTEKQIMEKNGYVQVYTLGNYVYTLSK